jgi:hypothetical protein
MSRFSGSGRDLTEEKKWRRRAGFFSWNDTMNVGIADQGNSKRTSANTLLLLKISITSTTIWVDFAGNAMANKQTGTPGTNSGGKPGETVFPFAATFIVRTRHD